MPEPTPVNTLEFWIYWLKADNTTEGLNITDKVIRDEYPLNVVQTANLTNEAEGTLKVLDPDGTIEKILQGIGGYNPYGGAVRLEVKQNGETKFIFWTTGKFRRKREILEFEYSSEKRVYFPSESPYTIADANRLLQILYGLNTCKSVDVFSNSSKLLLKVYAGVDIPENLQFYEISWVASGNYLYVLYRSILVKYYTGEIPYRIDGVLDLNSILNEGERITVSNIINGQEDIGVAGQIIGISGTSIEVVVNVATANTQATFNCFKVFNISTSLNSWTSGPFLIKSEDIKGIPYPSYSFVGKVGNTYAFLFKGFSNGTLIISDGNRYYSSLVSFPSNNAIKLFPKGFCFLGSDGWYNLFILGIRTLWLKVSLTTTSINVNTQSFIDITFTNEVESFWSGYLSADQTFIQYLSIRRTSSTETAQMGKITIGSSSLSNQIFRTLSNYPLGSIKGYGWDSYYRVVDVFITYNENGINKTKRFETGYTGTSYDLEFAVYLNFVNIIRGEGFCIYTNTGARKGGLGVLGNSSNLYMTEWSDEVLNVIPLGFILGHQINTWVSVQNSGLSLGINEYFNSQLVEGRDYEAHKRLIIETADGEIVKESVGAWAYVEKLVHLPVTGEMARVLILLRQSVKKIKHYRVQTQKDITGALAKKISFIDPEGRTQDAYLLGYSQNTDGIYTYDIYALNPVGDISWDIPEDFPSYLVLDVGITHSVVDMGTSFSYEVKIQYTSYGREHPTRINYGIIDTQMEVNVMSGSASLPGVRVYTYYLRWNYNYLSNFEVVITLSSAHAYKVYTYDIQTGILPRIANLRDLIDFTKNPVYINPNSNFKDGLFNWISDSGSTILESGQKIMTEDYYPILLKERDEEHFILNVAVKIRSNINALVNLLIYFYDEDFNPVGDPWEDSLYFTRDYVVEKQTKTVEMDFYNSGIKYFRVAAKNVSNSNNNDDIEVIEFGIYYDFVAYDSVKLGGRYYTEYSLSSHNHDDRYLFKNQSDTLTGNLTVTNDVKASRFFGNILTAEPTPDPGKVIFYAYDDGNYVRLKVAFNYAGVGVIRYIIYSWQIPR